MKDVIVTGLFSIAGTIIGYLFAYLLEKRKAKDNKKAIILGTEVEVYSKAIRYAKGFALYKELECVRGYEEYTKEMVEMLDSLYNEFHPTLSLIASREKANAFNDLRNLIEKGGITPSEAYCKAVEIFNCHFGDN